MMMLMMMNDASLAAPTDGPNPKEAVSRPLFIAICIVFGRKCLVKKMVQNEQNLHRPLLHKMQYVSIKIAVVGYFFESGRLWGYRPLPPTVGSIGLLSLQKYRPKIICPFTYVLQILLPEYLVLIKEDYVIYSVNVNFLVVSKVVLRYDMLCSPARGLPGYAMPCYAALCYAMLCYAMLC